MKINKITKEDKNYPDKLRSINQPPKELFYIGNIELLNTIEVAVVGSRKTTSYGRWVAHKLGETLGMNNITVISGMAVGIDTEAHKGALDANGKTIAVLGCGIDINYPASNRILKEKITKEGLIISEYPEGHKGSKFTFPQRNRIISGLSEAVVVAEAGLNSGAMITAELGEMQNKHVYAVPGNINSIYSAGANRLLKDGAMPLVVLDDLISDFGMKKNNVIYERWSLGKAEKSVLSCVAKMSEATIDDICGMMKKNAAEVSGIVTVLEMKGLVCTALGKVFIAK